MAETENFDDILGFKSVIAREKILKIGRFSNVVNHCRGLGFFGRIWISRDNVVRYDSNIFSESS